VPFVATWNRIGSIFRISPVAQLKIRRHHRKHRQAALFGRQTEYG
jgi:hypothetical protein